MNAGPMTLQTIFVRRHSNGEVGEVLIQPDGRYRAQKRTKDDGYNEWVAFRSNIDDLERAKEYADACAHAGGTCDRKCGPWLRVT